MAVIDIHTHVVPNSLADLPARHRLWPTLEIHEAGRAALMIDGKPFREIDARWPQEQYWHSPQGCRHQDFANYPILLRYLAQVQFYPHDFIACLERLGYRVVHEEYFSLPFQTLSSRLLGTRRGKRTSPLYLLVAEKL